MLNSTAVFFNVASIQEYVFNTNKLKQMVGASYIIKHIFDEFEKNLIKNTKEIYTNGYIGYIGGGNALILFDNIQEAKNAIKKFTRDTLKNYPGITFKIGIKENFNTTDSAFCGKKTAYQEAMKEIIRNANQQLNKHRPITILPKHGITADCPYSGLSAEIKIEEPEGAKWVSQSVAAKWSHFNKAIEEDEKLLKNAEMQNYIFAQKFDDLSDEPGIDAHIAIVHIDGNGIGKLFQEIKKIEETIDLSRKTHDIMEGAFIKTLKDFKKLIDDKKVTLKEKRLQIRPIILSGDEITFVCNSFYGIWLAQHFMQHFVEVTKEQTYNLEFSACAGVCITKTKYPFYRGYQLATELCQNAKKARENNTNKGNWIDFHIAKMDISGDLDEIRATQYINQHGHSLLMRPYSTDTLKAMINNSINLKKNIPHSKLKDLSDCLIAGKQQTSFWVKKARSKGLKFEIPCYEEIFDSNNKTPYFDLIELTEILKQEMFTDKKEEKQ